MDRIKVSDREEEMEIANIHGVLHRLILVRTLPAESANIVESIEPGGLADVIRKMCRSMDSAEALE